MVLIHRIHHIPPLRIHVLHLMTIRIVHTHLIHHMLHIVLIRDMLLMQVVQWLDNLQQVQVVHMDFLEQVRLMES